MQRPPLSISCQAASSKGADTAGRCRADLVCGILLTLVWLAVVILPGPQGDFPLNDDWSYGLVVRSLLETGSLQLTGWVSMPLVAQVAWGNLFCLPAGFSFTALRFSTLVLGLLGVLFSYGLLREARATASIAFLGALVVGVNPLYVVLSHSFMTDVPFFSLAVGSLLFLARDLRTRSRRDYVIGLALAVAATLVRQIGVIIPVAFAAAHLVRARGDVFRWRTIVRAVLPALAVFGALFFFRIWLVASAGLPELYDARSDVSIVASRSLLQHVGNAAWGGYVTLVYLGLFLLPFSAVVLLQKGRESARRARFLVVAAGLAAAGVVVAVYKGEFLPLTGNILSDLGLGPATLRDVYFLELDHLPSAPVAVWVTLTVLSIVSIAILVTHFALGWGAAFRWRGSPEDAWRSSLSVLVLLSAALHLIPMAGAGFFDRYMLILIPLALALVVQTTRMSETRPGVLGVRVGVAVALVLGALSIAGTHDYLSWNRARWQAADHLTDTVGVHPREIDGGFEFNGYYLYDESYEPRPDASWWWVYGDTYMLTFGPVDGYDVAGSYSYRRWLPAGEGRILILRKTESIQRSPLEGSDSGIPGGSNSLSI